MNLIPQPTTEFSENKSWFITKVLSKKRIAFSLLFYFIGHIFLLPVIWMIFLSLFYDMNTASVYAQAVNDFFNLFIFLIMFLPLLEESFEVFKKNVLYTLFHSLKWYIPLILTNALVSAIIVTLTGLEQSGNQSAIVNMYEQSVWAIAIPSILVAPLVEELIFRGIIFRGFRKQGFWIGSIVSSLSFGLLHVVISLITQNFADLVFIIPYGVMAFYFCLAYEKTKNIYGCYFLHLLNNVIAMIAIGFTATII